MDAVIKKPSVDVSGWESVVIHLSEGAYGDVTATNIRELINKDVAEKAKQKTQPAIESQEQYDNKYIEALFNRMKKYLDSIANGTQEVECVVDGANSNFSAYVGTGTAQGNINNLEDLNKLLRDGLGENYIRKVLEDIVTSFTESGLNGFTNDTIFELEIEGIDNMIDDMRADRLMVYYDEWRGGEDYQMGSGWWKPYTERILKMAILLREIVSNYLNKNPNFCFDDLWASLDSDDMTFVIVFEDDNGMDEIIETKKNLDDFVERYNKTHQ